MRSSTLEAVSPMATRYVLGLMSPAMKSLFTTYGIHGVRSDTDSAKQLWVRRRCSAGEAPSIATLAARQTMRVLLARSSWPQRAAQNRR